MAFALPRLPWKEAALAPHISAETVQYHYGKHHATYVTKLNELTKDTEWKKLSLPEIIKEAPEGGLLNNAAQAWNHQFYWRSLSPEGGGNPHGAIAERIDRDFGSFAKFKEIFSSTAAGHFGAGWAWLCLDKASNKLVVVGMHDGGCPLREGKQIPILTCDVWEHAYYIDYRNRRPEYIQAWWELVNWEFANSNLALGREHDVFAEDQP